MWTPCSNQTTKSRRSPRSGLTREHNLAFSRAKSRPNASDSWKKLLGESFSTSFPKKNQPNGNSSRFNWLHSLPKCGKIQSVEASLNWPRSSSCNCSIPAWQSPSSQKCTSDGPISGNNFTCSAVPSRWAAITGSLWSQKAFFDLSKPISLMKKTHIKNQRVICPDMSCRRREITIEPQGWHSNTFRGSRKQTWEIVKAGGEWPVGWEKIGDSNPKVLLPISGQQLLPRWDWHDMSHVVTQQFTLLILRDGEIQSVQQCEWNPISSTMWGPQDS